MIQLELTLLALAYCYQNMRKRIEGPTRLEWHLAR